MYTGTMFEINRWTITLVNTDGLWYAMMKREDQFYETTGYASRDEAKGMATILAYSN